MGGARVVRRGRLLKQVRAPQTAGAPLHIAAYRGHLEMVDFLFATGVHKDAPNEVREGRGCWVFKGGPILAGGVGARLLSVSVQMRVGRCVHLFTEFVAPTWWV